MSSVTTKFRLIGVEELLSLTGWSSRTLDRRLADGDFPQPVEGGTGKARKWALAQYENWVKRKMDKADSEAA